MIYFLIVKLSKNKSNLNQVMDDCETVIDTDIKSMILELHDKIENKTGKMYEIYLRESNKNMLNVTPFSQRNSDFVVSNMKFEYKELEGNYISCKAIEDKIFKLKFNGLDILNGSWKCPKCDTFGKSEHTFSNSLHNSLCQNPSRFYEHKSIWSNVKVSVPYQMVCVSEGGGSLNIMKRIGGLSYN